MKIRFFTIFLLVVLVLLLSGLAWLLYFSREEGKIYVAGKVVEDMVIVVNSMDRWAVDNNGFYPQGLNDLNKKSGKLLSDYYIKPLEESVVSFINDSIPSKIEYGKHKTGSINVYIFGDRNKYVVVGYTYKNLPIWRSDDKEFKQYYDAKLKTLKQSK